MRHPHQIDCHCDECFRERGQRWVASTLRKARDELKAEAVCETLQQELAQFVADPARPESRWDVVEPKASAPIASIFLQRPTSAAPVAKRTPGTPPVGDVPGQPAPGEQAPEWSRALTHQLGRLQDQLRANASDPHAALKLVNEMRDRLTSAITSGPDLVVGDPNKLKRGVEEALRKERADWRKSDLGRTARADAAVNRLRAASELPEIDDMGKAAVHEVAREPLLAAAAKRLDLEDDRALRPATEVGLERGSRAAIDHDGQREAHLHALAQLLTA